jgi:hypothetical protein
MAGHCGQSMAMAGNCGQSMAGHCGQGMAWLAMHCGSFLLWLALTHLTACHHRRRTHDKLCFYRAGAGQLFRCGHPPTHPSTHPPIHPPTHPSLHRARTHTRHPCISHACHFCNNVLKLCSAAPTDCQVAFLYGSPKTHKYARTCSLTRCTGRTVHLV